MPLLIAQPVSDRAFHCFTDEGAFDARRLSELYALTWGVLQKQASCVRRAYIANSSWSCLYLEVTVEVAPQNAVRLYTLIQRVASCFGLDGVTLHRHVERLEGVVASSLEDWLTQPISERLV